MTILAWLLAIGVSFPLLVACAECVAGLGDSRPIDPLPFVPPFTVLIPAYDEATGIAATIAAVSGQLRASDGILVVADNCTDGTAEVAIAGSASVCIRTNPGLVGKAHALAFGRAALRVSPPAVVILLDADCRPEDGALCQLAATAHRTQAAVQGEYLLSVPANCAPMVRISTFAFLVKNRVRQRGLRRLGGPAVLQGTGMALPWQLFDRAPLVTSSLVEDLKLGLDLVLDGHATLFEDRARFRSPASSPTATMSQRTRWEQGTLTTAARYLPRLIIAALRGRPKLLLAVADLAVPPLAMLAAIAGMATLALSVFALAGGAILPLAFILFAQASFGSVVALVWVRLGRTILPVAAIPAVARYIVWKLPIYCGLLVGGERRWIRTSRLP